jgi:predicted aminopeptidase
MPRFLKSRRVKRWLLAVLPLAALGAVCGCRTLGYYRQAIAGECGIITSERPIDKVLADPATPEPIREKLRLVEQLRAFAKSDLNLPVDGRYRCYADLHRPYVVWNVQAAPQFSLEPRTWWYPFVGSLEYRGYFSEHAAHDYALVFARQGDDVYVDGVEAYSTLGWFKDPVLNTFLADSEPELAETLFHELGHARVFAPGDTDFNEAYATTVGEEGARRWLRSKGDSKLLERYAAALRRNDQFVHLVGAARDRLIALYGDQRDSDGRVTAARQPPLPPTELTPRKEAILRDLLDDYAKLKVEWGGYTGYDEWFSRKPNNAQLNTVATYYDLVPAFERLLANNGGDLEKFYNAVAHLARMKKTERHRALDDLISKGVSPRIMTITSLPTPVATDSTPVAPSIP